MPTNQMNVMSELYSLASLMGVVACSAWFRRAMAVMKGLRLQFQYHMIPYVSEGKTHF